MNKNFLDTSSELLIQKYQNGIKLIRPQYKPSRYNELISVNEFFKETFSVFFGSINNVCQNMNEVSAEVCGFESPYSSMGKTAFDFADEKSAKLAISLDNLIISSNKTSIFEQELIRNDGLYHQLLTIRAP